MHLTIFCPIERRPPTQNIRASRSCPTLRPVALLVLLAAAARAWIVATHLLPGADRLGPAAIVAATELHGLQLFVLLALNIAREVFHGALRGLALRLREEHHGRLHAQYSAQEGQRAAGHATRWRRR